MEDLQKISFDKIEITGGFWKRRQEINRNTTIFSVENRFRDTGRFEAFKFNWKEGADVPKPHFFWDSDIAKWLESVACILQREKDESLYRDAREVIDDIAAHQDENGYFNIYHTVVEPDNRFKDRDHHELYCLGHLIEAAVAWFNATGESDFLETLDRYIDYVIRVFVVERSAGFVTPGHEEIELALIKLYRLKKDKKYLDLAMFFLNERGKCDPTLGNWARGMYNQSHLPVREQRTAEGHSVRACYLYSAMADAALETGDEELLEACKAIFDDIADKKMYITGGVGSSHHGEAFTVPYDLPNATAYAETCAAISLAMFAGRMQLLERDAKYADVVERVIYNGMLSGISLDGKSFFYENPLEIRLQDRTKDVSVNDGERLPITQRLEVFWCSCCPPNVTRFIASIGDYLMSANDDEIYLHQFMPYTAAFDGMKITMETEYPVNGNVKIRVRGAKGKTLFVRIPGWCGTAGFTTSRPDCDLHPGEAKGYAKLPVAEDDFTLDVDMQMEPLWIAANHNVAADAGKVALTYGPLVYCAEGIDHDFPLFAAKVDLRGSYTKTFAPEYDAPVFVFTGSIPADDGKGLYYNVADLNGEPKPVNLRFIPYFAFANRGESDMQVWFLCQ